MNESGQHLEEATLWQRRDGELSADEESAVQAHLEHCALCRERAARLEQTFTALREMHLAVQPTLAQRMRLTRVLEERFGRKELPDLWVEASRRLVRWLAPAAAILAVLFALLQREKTSFAGASANLLPETPESRLLFVESDEKFQQAVWDVALSLEENQK